MAWPIPMTRIIFCSLQVVKAAQTAASRHRARILLTKSYLYSTMVLQVPPDLNYHRILTFPF